MLLISLIIISTIRVYSINGYSFRQFDQIVNKSGKNYYNIHRNYINRENINSNNKQNDAASEIAFDLNTFIIQVIQNVLDDSYNITEQCRGQLKIWQELSEEKSESAISLIKALDSFGKVPSGLSSINPYWLGEYSVCINTIESKWKGKYCYISTSYVSIYQLFPYFQGIFYGMCVPDKCTSDDLTEITNYAASILPERALPFDLSNTLYDIKCNEGNKVDSFVIAVIVITGIVALVVLIGTITEISLTIIEIVKREKNAARVSDQNVENQNIEDKNQPKKPIYIEILLCFSAYSNSVKILKIVKNNEQFGCLHGIRTLSCFFILIHNQNYFHYYLFPPVWKKNFLASILDNNVFYVDNFFVLSGFLASYSFLKTNMGKTFRETAFHVIKYYLRRIWRISPAYYLIMLVTVAFTKYFIHGPLLPEYLDNQYTCLPYIWTNFLYINNYGPAYEFETCLGQSWYLGADMQFYILSPLILIPLCLKKKIYTVIGLLVAAFLLGLNIVAGALTTDVDTIYYPVFTIYVGKVYFVAWCRIGAFVIGILLGFKVYLAKQNRFLIKERSQKLIIYALLWLFSFAIMILMLVGNYGTDNQLYPMNKVARDLYEASSRILWSTGLAYVIYQCANSRGGIINRFLSWSGWLPWSKLSFCAYLIQLLVADSFYYSQEHIYGQQDWSSFILKSCGNILVTYAAAFFSSILFEMPFAGLEKFIFKIER